jgi:hypothetical protein
MFSILLSNKKIREEIKDWILDGAKKWMKLSVHDARFFVPFSVV